MSLYSFLLVILREHIEYGKHIKFAIIKDTQYEQITTFKFPPYARTKEMKRQLRLVESMFQRSKYPRIETLDFGCIQTYDKEAVVMLCDVNRIVIVVGSNPTAIKELSLATKEINEMIKKDENRYFITSYS